MKLGKLRGFSEGGNRRDRVSFAAHVLVRQLVSFKVNKDAVYALYRHMRLRIAESGQRKPTATSRILRSPQLNRKARQRLLAFAHRYRIPPVREATRDGDFFFG